MSKAKIEGTGNHPSLNYLFEEIQMCLLLYQANQVKSVISSDIDSIQLKGGVSVSSM